jgi:cytochrome c oxidase subunit 2
MFNIALLDAPTAWGVNFQDPASPIAVGIQDLHHDIMLFLIAIALFTFWMLGRTIWLFDVKKNPVPSMIVHGVALEIAWTVAPSIILLILAIPSFALIYAMDQDVDPAVTIKVTGHQWFWKYQYSDYAAPNYVESDDGNVALEESEENDRTIDFDSYMIHEDELEEGNLRLLEVDNRLVLPVKSHIRLLITAADVIHNFAVPSLAVKCDGLPGRLNQTSLFILREGLFYGQCSELCGVNHGFMSTCVEGVTMEEFKKWVQGAFPAAE